MAYSATATVKIIINVGTHSPSNGYEPIYVGQEVSSGKYFFMTPSTPAGTAIGSSSTNRQWIYHNVAWANAYNGKGNDPLTIDPSLDYSGFMTDEVPNFVDGTYGKIPNVNVVNDAGDRLRIKENTARNIVPFTLFGDGINSNPFASTVYNPAVSTTETTGTTGTISTFTSSITDFVTNNPLTSVLIGVALGFGVYWAWKEGVFESKKKKRKR